MPRLPEFETGGEAPLSRAEERQLARRRELAARKDVLEVQIGDWQTQIGELNTRMREIGLQMSKKISPVRETLSRVLDEYAVEYDWAEFNRFSWVIAPDISGSMSSRIANSALTFAEVSGMFAGFFMKGLRHVRVLPWDTEVHDYDVATSAPVAEHMTAIRNMCRGGTYMEAPVKYMIEHAIGVDFAVFLTDTEEYGRGWLAEWKRYRGLFPQAQAFLLRADTYQSAPISEADAAGYGIWQIFGWNDSVVEYMRHILTRTAVPAAK